MKYLLTLFLIVMTTTMYAGDFTGRWAGKLNNMDVALELTDRGNTLVGSITTGDGTFNITNGKIDGNKFTFNFATKDAMNSGRGIMNGDKLSVTITIKSKQYSGTLDRLQPNQVASVQNTMQPGMTEFWQPVPKVIDPGPYVGMVLPPSDAIVLFDGDDLSKWKSRDGSPAKWRVADGVLTVEKGTGDISTRQKFGDYQLHIEWRIPSDIQGESQSRGNSGLFLQDLSDDLKIPEYWYEVQILDSYKNETYVNGQAGSIYKQNPPMVNAMRKPGEWNVYDVTYSAPRFNPDGSLFAPARVTVFHNGVLIQDNFEIRGHTAYIGHPKYFEAHEKAPISLQDHGDPSKAISFRNIWIRER